MNPRLAFPQGAPSPWGRTHINNHLPVFAFLQEAFPNWLNSDLGPPVRHPHWLAGNTVVSKLDPVPALMELPVEHRMSRLADSCGLSVVSPKHSTWRRAKYNTCAVLHAKSLQSCPTLCNPVDCSPPGCSVHGILQARILEWVAVPFSRGSSRPRHRTQVSCFLHWQAGSLPLSPPGKPYNRYV